MRILIAAKHPHGGARPVGGVQSWSKTVADQLTAMGHEVVHWGPEFSLPDGRFDAGILSNLQHTSKAIDVCERVVKVSHGIIPDERGDSSFIATSEEVSQAWGCRAVVRQPLDLEFWHDAGKDRGLLVRHSYRRGLTPLPDIAAQHGLEFAATGALTPEAVRDLLQRARVVVATGRAAVEAMACGACVAIADAREYQQPLVDPDPCGAMHRNYSGRGGRPATASELKMAVAKAMQRGSLRAHAERHHDAAKITEELLCLLS